MRHRKSTNSQSKTDIVKGSGGIKNLPEHKPEHKSTEKDTLGSAAECL